MKEWITIVIPVYNRAALVERTLRSVRAQSVRPLRLILVDNGSTDESLEVCRRFRQENRCADFGIDVYEEPTPGANAARNRGLREVESEWVLFFDSDDELVPDALARIGEAAERNPEAEIIGFTAKRFGPDGRVSYKRRCFSSKPEDQIVYGMLGTSCFVSRTALLRSVGGWDERLLAWQDWNLAIRLLMRQPKMVWIRRPFLVKLHVHAESITGLAYAPNRERHFRAMAVTADWLADSSWPGRTRAIHYIHLKMLILAGLYRRERHRELAEETWNEFLRNASPSRWKRGCCRLLFCYIGAGLPGGGTLARWLL